MLKRLGLSLLLLAYIFIPACAGGGGQMSGAEAASNIEVPIETPVLSINSGKLDPEFGEDNSGVVTTDR